MSVARNAPCPCGSGRKHKHCCAGKTPWHKQPAVTGGLVGVVLLIGLVLAGMAFTRSGSNGPPGPAPPGKVWSPEHGHWHDAP